MQLRKKAIFKDYALHPLTLISHMQSISEMWYQEWKKNIYTHINTPRKSNVGTQNGQGSSHLEQQCSVKETSTQVHFDAEETKYDNFLQ